MEGQQQQEYDTSENKHLLNSKWVVWYHNPSDKSWERDSYKDILEIASLEDFFVLKIVGRIACLRYQKVCFFSCVNLKIIK